MRIINPASHFCVNNREPECMTLIKDAFYDLFLFISVPPLLPPFLHLLLVCFGGRAALCSWWGDSPQAPTIDMQVPCDTTKFCTRTWQ